jgi:hypothetical protein
MQWGGFLAGVRRSAFPEESGDGPAAAPEAPVPRPHGARAVMSKGRAVIRLVLQGLLPDTCRFHSHTSRLVLPFPAFPHLRRPSARLTLSFGGFLIAFHGISKPPSP